MGHSAIFAAGRGSSDTVARDNAASRRGVSANKPQFRLFRALRAAVARRLLEGPLASYEGCLDSCDFTCTCPLPGAGALGLVAYFFLGLSFSRMARTERMTPGGSSSFVGSWRENAKWGWSIPAA